MQLAGCWSQQESVINIFLERLALCALASKYALLHMLTPLLFSRYVLTFDRGGVEAKVGCWPKRDQVEYISMITEGWRGVGVVDKNTFVFSDIPSKPIIPVIHSDHNCDGLVQLRANQPFLH